MTGSEPLCDGLGRRRAVGGIGSICSSVSDGSTAVMESARTDHNVGGSSLFLEDGSIIERSVDKSSLGILLGHGLAASFVTNEQRVLVIRVGFVNGCKYVPSDISSINVSMSRRAGFLRALAYQSHQSL